MSISCCVQSQPCTCGWISLIDPALLKISYDLSRDRRSMHLLIDLALLLLRTPFEHAVYRVQLCAQQYTQIQQCLDAMTSLCPRRAVAQ